jgi:hypothetical protein
VPYSKTSWVNNSTPAINATNLNKIEQGISDAEPHRGTSAPASPVTGKLWEDTNTTPATLKAWTGSAWQTVQATGTATGATAVATVADLPTTAVQDEVRYVLGRTAVGDGGGGTFRANPADTTTADDGGIVRVRGTLRWVRLPEPEPLDIRWFGGKADDQSVDNAIPLTSALAKATAGFFKRSIFIPYGDFWFFNSSPVTIPADGVEIFGEGRGGTRLNFSGSAATFLDLTNTHNHTFRDLWVRTEGASSTVFLLSASSECLFDAVRIVGTHSATENKPNQFGVKLLNNAGNNLFRACKIDALGVGMLADTNATEIIGGGIAGCQKNLRCTSTGTVFIMGVEFGGTQTPGETQVHLDLVDADRIHATHCWFEGSDNAAIVGASDLSTGVDSSFTLAKCYIQSRNTNLILHKAARVSLEDCTFTNASGGAPTTPLSINATGCPTGYAKNLESNGATLNGYPASIPAGWVRVN